MKVAVPFSLLSSLLLVLSGRAILNPVSGGELPPSARQRIESTLRSKAEFPPATSLSFTTLGPSEVPGFDKLSVHFSSAVTGGSGELALLISKDGSRIAQLSIYDLPADPREKVPFAGRPGRGGPITAPVIVVGFDDLECPYCAQFHRDLFPALVDHYKDLVRIVYQNLPSSGHPWAMHAAIDTDCLATSSPAAYWSAVDQIHEHAKEYGGIERKLAAAEQELDDLTLEQGRRFHINQEQLRACIDKQDPTPEKESVALADRLGVATTPTLFVNGARSEGAVPIDFIFDMVDNALRAEGQNPPPRRMAGDVEPARKSR